MSTWVEKPKRVTFSTQSEITQSNRERRTEMLHLFDEIRRAQEEVAATNIESKGKKSLIN